MNGCIITDPLTGAQCRRILHPSGLEIRVAEQPGFHTVSAQLGVRYGSVHTQLRTGGKCLTVPAGTAHFLEHRMFDSAAGDAAAAFSRLGASDNAFTSFDRTVYYFSAYRNAEQAVALLLSFVQTPYFTQARTEREKRIIAQEIREYSMDSPEDRVFFLLLEGLYHAHPVRYDVAGTLASIEAVTPDMLYAVHGAVYRPSRMVLCCAGNITAEQVAAAADAVMQPAAPCDTELLQPEEPDSPAAGYIEAEMDISKPQFAFGFKSKPVQGTELLRQTLLGELVLDLIAGPSSPLYRRLLAQGLINDTFSTSAFTGESWFVLMAEGESDAPEQVRAELTAAFADAAENGIDTARFADLKAAAYGDAILSCNTPGACAEAMLDAAMWNISSPYARTELLPRLTPEDALECLRTRLSPAQACLAVLHG